MNTKSSIRMIATLAILIISFVSVGSFLLRHSIPTIPAFPKSPALPASESVTHPCYIDSVVMCGVWTADEAGVPTGHSIEAPADAQYYVSYKFNGHIYWSQKPVRLHKGELLWTDGKRLIRARCGNELRTASPVPVAHSVEVIDSDLDQVIPQPMPDMPSGTVYQSSFTDIGQPPTVTGFSPIMTSGLPPIFSGCCGIGIPLQPTPVVQTPDPSEWVLFFIMLVFLLAAFMKA